MRLASVCVKVEAMFISRGRKEVGCKQENKRQRKGGNEKMWGRIGAAENRLLEKWMDS